MLELGNVVATAGVAEWINETTDRVRDVARTITRHANGDWGEVCPEDSKANDFAAKNDERILSAYTVDGKKLWIITECDRSVTTVLFPEEY
jgi:hypothetical protein